MFKTLIKKLAPTIATVVGGPHAGMAVKFLSQKFLGKDDGTEEELEEAIQNATPEQLAQIRKIDNDFKLELKKLNLRPEELALEDTQGARDMAKTTGAHYQFILSQELTAIVAIIVAFMFYIVTENVNIDQTFLSLLSMILGYVFKAWIDSLNFFTGTSLGSKMKTAFKNMKGD